MLKNVVKPERPQMTI